LLWDLLGFTDFLGCELSRKKTHEKTAYSSSISQVHSAYLRTRPLRPA